MEANTFVETITSLAWLIINEPILTIILLFLFGGPPSGKIQSSKYTEGYELQSGYILGDLNVLCYLLRISEFLTPKCFFITEQITPVSKIPPHLRSYSKTNVVRNSLQEFCLCDNKIFRVYFFSTLIFEITLLLF